MNMFAPPAFTQALVGLELRLSVHRLSHTWSVWDFGSFSDDLFHFKALEFSYYRIL